ncbi:MAG TPA: hypothetical protein PLK27_01800 [Neisseria sp.]|nr:hypothetical protein [Neisseria sp.]
MSETVKAQAEDRTPMALLPYQQAWCADQSPVKLCEKSRRIGLSWGEAADTALLAASGSGMDAWYIGYNKDMALEFIRDCANWAKFYNLAAGEITETAMTNRPFWPSLSALLPAGASPHCPAVPPTCAVNKAA